MELLRNLPIGKKFALIAITIFVAAISVVIIMVQALTTLSASSDWGWQRLTAAQQITLDSVIKLGEQSQTVGNIINSVAALAEQSNSVGGQCGH